MPKVELNLGIVKFTWEDGKKLRSELRGVFRWFRQESPRPILVIGAGGVGKTTFARFLAGESDSITDRIGEYREDFGVSQHKLKDDPRTELVVAPGQSDRRQGWADLLNDIASGKYRGIVHVVAYGRHALLGGVASHVLATGTLREFRRDYFAHCRQHELQVMEQLARAAGSCSKKLWLLSLIAKEDLWAGKRQEVERFYREGRFGELVAQVASGPPATRVLVEHTAVSLVIANLRSSEGELLEKNHAGYDQPAQVQSLRRLLETIQRIRQWEDRT